MPSRDYYLSDDAAMKGVARQVPRLRHRAAEAAGSKDPAADANDRVRLETKIARAQASLVDSQDIHKANNLWSMADFASKAPGPRLEPPTSRPPACPT